jgi:type II secretory pathway pseudopilin PulG
MLQVTRSSGFTFIELIISITVFVFLTTIVVFGFRGAGQANDVRQSAAELVANLRRLQTLAQSGAAVSVCSDYSTNARVCSVDPDCGVGGGLSCLSVLPAGGFGVYVSAAPISTYSLFADLNNDGTWLATRDVLIEGGSVSMLSGTRLSALMLPDPTSVTFAPPRGSLRGNPTPDPYFCVGHDRLNVVRKVSIKSITGQIDETAVTVCP